MTWKRFLFLATFFWSAFFTLVVFGLYLLFLATDPSFGGTPTLTETVWVASWMPPLCGLILGVVFTIMFFFFPWLEKRFDKNPQFELPL